jgi:hypothetical protein
MYSRNKELFLLSLVILMTVIAWIVVDLYHIQNNTNFVVDYQKSSKVVIKPLVGVDLLKKLEQRK